MLHLKKLFFISTVFILGLSSCSNDSNSGNVAASIVGKWQFTKEGEITNNQEVLDDYQHTSGCTKDFTEILTGNIFKQHLFDNPDCQETIDTGTWTRNNSSLVLTYPNPPIINAEILELTNTTLKVKYVFSGVTKVIVFTRIQ